MLVAALAAGVLLLRSAQVQGVEGILESPVWRVVSSPLRCFFDAFLSENWLDLLRFGALGLLVNAALLGVVFGLDADYLETSASYSSRVYGQIQRLRGGPSISAGDDTRTRSATQRRSLPMPSFLGGIGPLVWRQLTTAVRLPGPLFRLVLVMSVMMASLLSGLHDVSGGSGLMVLGIVVVLLPIFLTPLLLFDFRGDLDRLETLKTLPLPACALPWDRSWCRHWSSAYYSGWYSPP